MARKSYKILKTIIAIILLTVTMLGLVSSKNNSIAVNYNGTYSNTGTQLLGNSMLYNTNYGYNYVPYRGLALQSSQVYAMSGSSYKNPTLNGEGYIIPSLLTDPNLYCMNNGYIFNAGIYMCYDIGIISPEMAYVVAQQKEPSRNQNYDLEANAIWHLSILNGEKILNSQLPIFNITSAEEMSNYDPSSWEKYKEYNISSGAEMLNQILGEAKVASNLKSEGNISINKVEDELYPNEEGKYGPFKITYPNYNGVLVGKSIEVLVNGKKLENTPASDAEFYLTEEDGIVAGEKNTIKVVYIGYKYSGTYAKFTPYRNMTIVRKCERM